MLFNLLRRARAPVQEAPPDSIVYAIGDVHGRADLFEPLLQAIADDAVGARSRRKIRVFLGDYVDRGPDSRGVLDRLVELARNREDETHFLCGNHDEAFLAFLDDPAAGPSWCDCGGRETLASYGVAAPTARNDIQGWAATAAAMKDVLPSAHRRLLEALEESVSLGGYFFAHAGAKPGVPLDQQARKDLLWIRGPFLEDTRRFERVVIHGHTPAEAIHSDARRIGVDTGAYATGILSAVRLEGRERSFIQAAARLGGTPQIVRGSALEVANQLQGRRRG